MSLKFVTTKYTADWFKANSTVPQLRVDINKLINFISLLCWTIWNLINTDLPDRVVRVLRKDT